MKRKMSERERERCLYNMWSLRNTGVRCNNGFMRGERRIENGGRER